MHLTLVVAGLLDIPESVLADADAGAPALTRLLTAAEPPSVDREGAIGVTCTALGIAKQRDWPVAPWLAHGAGIEATARYWLCAEPATFEVGRGDVRLSDIVHDLAASETTALLSSLNAHFSSDGIRFEAPDAVHWLVGAEAPQSLSTLPPERALGRALLGHLPEGPDAGRWRAWHNEIQMLFFEHPVNVAREAAGRAVVNSVWLWGGGAAVAERTRARIAALYANAWRWRELARATNVASARVPASFDALHDPSSPSPALVWLDPRTAAEPQQRGSWFVALDRDWAAPARRALHSGTIGQLDIVVAGRSTALRFAARRPSLARRLRTWRSPPRLSTLLAPYLED